MLEKANYCSGHLRLFANSTPGEGYTRLYACTPAWQRFAISKSPPFLQSCTALRSLLMLVPFRRHVQPVILAQGI